MRNLHVAHEVALVWRFPVWGPRIAWIFLASFVAYFLPMIAFGLIILAPLWLAHWFGGGRASEQ